MVSSGEMHLRDVCGPDLRCAARIATLGADE